MQVRNLVVPNVRVLDSDLARIVQLDAVCRGVQDGWCEPHGAQRQVEYAVEFHGNRAGGAVCYVDDRQILHAGFLFGPVATVMDTLLQSGVSHIGVAAEPWDGSRREV